MKGFNINSLKDKYLSGRIVFAVDVLISMAGSIASMLILSFVLGRQFLSQSAVVTYLLTALVVSAAVYVFTGTFRIIIRHIVAKDLAPFGIATLAKGICVVAVLAAFGHYTDIVRVLGVIDFLITFVLLVGIRVCMLIVYEYMVMRIKSKSDLKRILVYGVSNKSAAVVPRLQQSDHYKIVGFIEYSPKKESLLLEQIPVYSFTDQKSLNDILAGNMADAVLFTKDTDAQAEEGRLIKYCLGNNIKILMVPNVDEVSDGKTLFRPRDIRIEDLLGREEITISLDEIRNNFSERVVLVTGAAGSIGSELVRQLAGFGVKQIVLFDNAETPLHNLRLELEDKFPELDFVPIVGDLRQVPRLDFAFRTYRPQVVFHAAAYKHVPLMEENPCEAIMVNTWGTRSVADRCIEYDVEKMVMISTDKAVNPTNIMGCTKRLAEIYVQSLGLAIERGLREGKTKFVTTRFGNVLGSNGSVIPRFREQIAKGGPVTVTHPDINRFFMTIPEACRLVLEAATMGTGNQIFVFDMGEPVKIDYLARRMITLAGFVPDKDIKIEYSGLRLGEKLYEEVLSNKENTLPTFHDRIRIANVREYDYSEVLPVFSKLHHLAEDVKIEPMVMLMKETVPEFKSENSKFQQFDK